MAHSDDQTLFAWQLMPEDTKANVCGPLAPHPSRFRASGHLLPIPDSDIQYPYSMTNKGLRIQIPVIHSDNAPCGMAFLDCSTSYKGDSRIGIPVVRLGPPGSSRYARDAHYSGPFTETTRGFAEPTTIHMKQEPDEKHNQLVGMSVHITATFQRFSTPMCWSMEYTLAGNDSDRTSQYVLEFDCRRGAILFQGPNDSHLLIVFNVERQHSGVKFCKGFFGQPSMSPTEDPGMGQHQKTVSDAEAHRVQTLAEIVKTTQTTAGQRISRTLCLEPLDDARVVLNEELRKQTDWNDIRKGRSMPRSSLSHCVQLSSSEKYVVHVKIEPKRKRTKTRPMFGRIKIERNSDEVNLILEIDLSSV